MINILSFLASVLAAFVLIGWLPASVFVLFHEVGHLTAARCLGVSVERLKIGWGLLLPPRHDRYGTEWVIGLPIGGRVDVFGEKEDCITIPPNLRAVAFCCQPPMKRAIIAGAGPFASIILPLMAFVALIAVAPDGSYHVAGFENIANLVKAMKAEGFAVAHGNPGRSWTAVFRAVSPTSVLWGASAWSLSTGALNLLPIGRTDGAIVLQCLQEFRGAAPLTAAEWARRENIGVWIWLAVVAIGATGLAAAVVYGP